jgi:hypothetical protein
LQDGGAELDIRVYDAATTTTTTTAMAAAASQGAFVPRGDSRLVGSATVNLNDLLTLPKQTVEFR